MLVVPKNQNINPYILVPKEHEHFSYYLLNKAATLGQRVQLIDLMEEKRG